MNKALPATAFNKNKVQQFFHVYRGLETHPFTPARVWNKDETGITNVQESGKIVATKGVRQAGKMTSEERGAIVTVLCAMSAAGHVHIPSQAVVATQLHGSPPQSVGYVSSNGWADAALFVKWLAHFFDFTNASKETPQIIVMDGHNSHKTLVAIDYARSHGVHVVTLTHYHRTART